MDLAKTAILVVDPQNDYCAEGGIIHALGYDVSGRDEVAKSIQRLLDGLREKVAATFFIRTETPSWGRSTPLSNQYGRNALKRSPDPTMSDWFGVSPEPGDHVITKGRYSAFQATALDAALRAIQIETVIVCGFTTEVCVDSTVRDAFFRDYNVICVSDCCAASTPERHEVAIGVIDTFFGRVLDSSSLFSEAGVEVKR